MKYFLSMVVALLVSLGSMTVSGAEPVEGLQAAFVRNNDLWTQTGNKEKQLTRGQYIRNPKWSFDNQWIAYTKGELEQELWLFHLASGKSQLISTKANRHFEWAPDKNKLAFQIEQTLQIVDVEQLNKRVEVAKRIGNFSWLPDGSGFLASSAAELLEDGGWLPIQILKIPLKGNVEMVYELPKQSDDFFAVGTSIFKWSANRQWIAFLANPTASLSADGNTLCVLSADGSTFKMIDQMLNDPHWFQWAPQGERLAYIAGVGREATSNKQLKVIASPYDKAKNYTPWSYVDQGFTWKSAMQIVVSRSKEAAWSSDVAKRKSPFLVDVNLQTDRQIYLTHANKLFGDYNPIMVSPTQLLWFLSNRKHADVILASSEGKHAKVWIKDIELGLNYYERWNWDPVFSLASNR